MHPASRVFNDHVFLRAGYKLNSLAIKSAGGWTSGVGGRSPLAVCVRDKEAQILRRNNHVEMTHAGEGTYLGWLETALGAS